MEPPWVTPLVLLVDDSRVVRKIVEMTLWRERIEVVSAPDWPLGCLGGLLLLQSEAIPPPAPCAPLGT